MTTVEQLKQLGLTKREIEISEYLIQGLSNKVIAEKIFISDKGVRYHNTNIFKKTGVNDRKAFMFKFLQNTPFRVVVEEKVFNTFLPTGKQGVL